MRAKEVLFYGFIGVFFFVVVLFCINKLDEYKLNCKVYEINTVDDVVTFETADGHLYDCYVRDIENFDVGDTWEVKFKDWEDADPKNDTIQKIITKKDQQQSFSLGEDYLNNNYTLSII